MSNAPKGIGMAISFKIVKWREWTDHNKRIRRTKCVTYQTGDGLEFRAVRQTALEMAGNLNRAEKDLDYTWEIEPCRTADRGSYSIISARASVGAATYRLSR